MKLSEWLKPPEVKKIKDLDKPEALSLSKQIINQKRFLKNLYTEWYMEFKKVSNSRLGSPEIELGSGGGFLKDVMPSVVTSDIIFMDGIDINFSATNMPFKDDSISSFFMLDVLHHISDSFVFLKELRRCLRCGGKIVMIEPANTLWARFIWKNFHHEPFDPYSGWQTEGKGPLSCANSAIPWIIFFRDREKFNDEFPELRINRMRFHTPFRYLISGGVSMRQLLPSFAYNPVKAVEFILNPFNRYLGMFLTIEIERIK